MFVDPDKLAEPGRSHIKALQAKIFEEVERNGTLDGLLNGIAPDGNRIMHITDAIPAAMDDGESDE